MAPDARSEDLRFPARDGFELAGTVHEPAASGAPRVAVVLNSATAVPRGYYASFAEFLARRGHPVLTFDYRGIGGSRPGSLRGFPGSMREWATEDVAGALAFAERRWPGARLVVVGHSIGGWALGLVPGADRLALAVLVGSQSGYWGHWPGIARVRRWIDWHVLVPGVAKTFGYVPGWMGMGEDLPRNAALDWARWGRSPRFTLDDPAERAAGYARMRVPLVAYAFTDDPYAPIPAVEALLAMMPNAPVSRRFLTPEEAGGPIGHFGFFRPRHTPLWEEVARALDQLGAGHEAFPGASPTPRHAGDR